MDSYQLRLTARQSLTGNYWSAVLVAFVASIFGALVVSSNSFSFDIDEEIIKNLPQIFKIVLILIGSIGGTLGLVSFVLGGVVQLGYAQYLLKQHDREITSVKELFSQFDRFGRPFCRSSSGVCIHFCGLYCLSFPALLSPLVMQ